jgi:hypothetical protein
VFTSPARSTVARATTKKGVPSSIDSSWPFERPEKRARATTTSGSVLATPDETSDFGVRKGGILIAPGEKASVARGDACQRVPATRPESAPNPPPRTRPGPRAALEYMTHEHHPLKAVLFAPW